MPEPVIRKIEEADVPRILKLRLDFLLAHGFDHWKTQKDILPTIKNDLASDTERAARLQQGWVYDVSKGALIYAPGERVNTVSWCYVNPNSRRGGVGKALIAEMAHECLRQEKQMSVITVPMNSALYAPAIAFYSRLGFRFEEPVSGENYRVGRITREKMRELVAGAV